METFNDNKKRNIEDQPQFLRVRRRRNAVTANTLRLLKPFEESFDDLNVEETTPAAPTRIVYRRVSNFEENKKRKSQILDVVLEESNSPERHSKRRRVTLQRPIVKYPVLTPEQRRIDDSLKEVLQGNAKLYYHIELVKQLYPDTWRSKLLWSNQNSGTWIHAAALWNEVELLAKTLPETADPKLDLLQALDEDGRTALQVAQLSGHGEIVQILEDEVDGDEFDYVYDIYHCITEPGDAKLNDESILDCEITDKANPGYWNEEGHFEMLHEEIPFVPIDDDDDDHDSNDENWSGNDYPDDDSDDSEYDDGYRHRAASDDFGDYDAAY